MDSRQAEYHQQQDQASSAQYPPNQDPRAPNFSSSATPSSDYANLPQSARSGTFPEYIQRGQGYPPQAQGAPGGNMAHAQSPSMSSHQQADNHRSQHSRSSNDDVPIDPSIASASPTYPPHQQYSPHQFQGHETGGMYPINPADYAARGWPPGYHHPPPHMPQYSHQPGTGPPTTPGMVSPGGHPLSTVYSFVPIPGAQQHKRPRRRYEEIERMYKCGWQGCEKAYGTLNHLNAHVTMQSHGAKRTPEEFKEIRKEWKAKKKEEEQARKAEEDRHRQQVDERGGQHHAGSEQQVYGQMRTPVGPPSQMGGPQLPPIGYAPASGPPSQGQYAQQSPAMEGQGMPQYARNGPGYANESAQGGSYPASPYGQQNQQMR